MASASPYGTFSHIRKRLSPQPDSISWVQGLLRGMGLCIRPHCPSTKSSHAVNLHKQTWDPYLGPGFSAMCVNLFGLELYLPDSLLWLWDAHEDNLSLNQAFLFSGNDFWSLLFIIAFIITHIHENSCEAWGTINRGEIFIGIT